MAHNAQRLINQFVVISPTGKIQSAFNTPMANADLTYRLKCDVTVEDVVDRETELDCERRYAQSRTTNTRLKRFTFNFPTTNPQEMAIFGGYYFGSVLAPTGTPANEVQTFTRTGTVSGGTFTVALSIEGRTGTTQAIAWNATAAAIQAALIKTGASIGQILKEGDVNVTGDWTTAITNTFGGRFQSANLPLMTIDTVNLTGTTPGIAVASPTDGQQRFHDFAISSSDAKVYFTFGLGFKTGNLATEKYYNAVVERFDPTAPRNGKVGMSVSILCNYEAEQVTGFTVPQCVSYLPLKTSDVRFEANNEWKTLDVQTLTATHNDNVPVDADTFGFDSTEPDSLEKGDVPAFAVNGQVFGATNDTADNFAVAVRAEREIPMKIHFGMPGNRFSLIYPLVSVVPQSNSRPFAGTRNRSVIAFDGLPLRDGANAPVNAEAYVSQATAFLLS
jgi:hypothetical protein